MKNEIDKTVERIEQLPDGAGRCAIFRDEIHKRYPSIVLSAKGLKALATAYTKAVADLATAKQELEYIAGNWECGHQGECRCLADIAQDTLDKIGKE